MPKNPDRTPVQRLTWRLLADAESRPALIHRSENPAKVTNERSIRSFPAMALLSDPAVDVRQYLENLVTIAVGSAREAEDTLFELCKANKKARRAIAVVASLGALGLMVGVAGFTGSRSVNERSEVRREVVAPSDAAQDIASLQQQRKVEEASLASQEAARAALQHQIADLQQQANALRDQVTRSSRELEAANIEAAKLPHNSPPKGASSQDQVALGSQTTPQASAAEPATSSRQKPHGQQLAVLPLRPPTTSSLIPAATTVQPIPVFMHEPSASQQLLIARQWLATGRLDQARRILAVVQTRVVLQPTGPNGSSSPSVNALATNVGNAIRWLDMGSAGAAMQALNQAMLNAGAD